MNNSIKKALNYNKGVIFRKNYTMSSFHYLMYSKMRLDARKLKLESYDGSFHCGIMSLICLDTLLKKDYNRKDIKVYKSSIGYGKYIEDHVYLKMGDILIDPTYKQFMRYDVKTSIDNYIHNYTDNEYQKMVYEELPEFYVGDIDNLYGIYDKTINIKKKVYGNITESLDDVTYFWDKPLDVTDYFIDNLYQVDIVREKLKK